MIQRALRDVIYSQEWGFHPQTPTVFAKEKKGALAELSRKHVLVWFFWTPESALG